MHYSNSPIESDSPLDNIFIALGNECRIKKAKELLSEGKYKVYEVAQMVKKCYLKTDPHTLQ